MLVEFRDAVEGLKVVITISPPELDALHSEGVVRLDEYDESLVRLHASKLTSIQIELGQ